MDIKLTMTADQLTDFTAEYQATLTSEADGKVTTNPQTREEFALGKIKTYISNVIESVRVNKAVETTRKSTITSAKVDLATLKVEGVK